MQSIDVIIKVFASAGYIKITLKIRIFAHLNFQTGNMNE